MASYPAVCRMLSSNDKLLTNCRHLCKIWRTNSKRLSKSNQNIGCSFSTSASSVLCKANRSTATGDSGNNGIFPSLSYMYVRTSVNYWYENQEGLVFDVGYIDTHSSMAGMVDNSQAIIVGIPCLRGTHTDLMPALSSFAALGYRVLIPNFPGSPHTKGVKRADDGFFSYSLEEKAMFLQDFLLELGIERVDLYVTDGYGMFTVMMLCCEAKEQNKAVAMINPKGFTKTSDMEPEKLFKDVATAWEVQFKRPIIRLHLLLWRFFHSSKQDWSLSDFIWQARSIKGLSFPEMRAYSGQCTVSGIPQLFIYSSQDKHVQDIEDMLEESRVPRDDFTEYDENDKLVCQGKKDSLCSGVVFGQSLEDPSKTQMQVIRTKLYEFFKMVTPAGRR